MIINLWLNIYFSGQLTKITFKILIVLSVVISFSFEVLRTKMFLTWGKGLICDFCKCTYRHTILNFLNRSFIY